MCVQETIWLLSKPGLAGELRPGWCWPGLAQNPAQSLRPPNALTEMPPFLPGGRDKGLSETKRVGDLGSDGKRILVQFSFLLHGLSSLSLGVRDRSERVVLWKMAECPEEGLT